MKSNEKICFLDFNDALVGSDGKLYSINKIGEVVAARDLRENDLWERNNRCKITNKLGCYRWFAPETVIRNLLNSETVGKNHDNLISHLEKRDYNGDPYFYIYIGIASSSLQLRLNEHINGVCRKILKRENKKKAAFGSTLRRSLGAIISGSFDEEKINKIIDELIVVYHETDMPKTESVRKALNAIELQQMTNYVLPLNIDGNYCEALKAFLTKLKCVRKAAEKKFIEEC